MALFLAGAAEKALVKANLVVDCLAMANIIPVGGRLALGNLTTGFSFKGEKVIFQRLFFLSKNIANRKKKSVRRVTALCRG
jgi:hypothetical protein